MSSKESTPDAALGARRPRRGFSRRAFLAGGALAAGGAYANFRDYDEAGCRADVFVGKAAGYQGDLAGIVLDGLRELGVDDAAGRRILLKPNLVEPHADRPEINTHPLFVRAVAEAFLRLGAREVTVAEGQGHRRDSLLVLAESGLGEALREDRIRFVDLNNDSVVVTPNAGDRSSLGQLLLPRTLRTFDWVVSLPKMKTHHWTGVTLSMKNLFGLMPGIVYGWPKNVLHQAGIDESIFDIAATVHPQLAIVDGIVGMDGDGPIMGNPHPAGVVVMGRNLPAVDATAARIMGIDPNKIAHLHSASGRLGPIECRHIAQRGELPESLRTDFALVDFIAAQRGIRLES